MGLDIWPRIRYSLLMNKPSPMLAVPLKGEPKRGSVFEPKFDGIRVIVHKVGDDLQVYTRTFHNQLGKLPHLEEAFRAIDFDFTLDGEIISVDKTVDIMGQKVPVASFSGAQSVMGSGVTKAAASRDKLTFVVFDCLGAQGKDLTDVPDILRRGAGELIVELLRAHSKYVMLSPRWRDLNKEEQDSLYGEIIAHGGEGLMIKNPLAIYQSGKRPAGVWQKRKSQETADVVIMGYKPGENGFTGLIGAVEFGQYKNGRLVARSRCSGMDMAMRKEFTENGEAYVGKVMEIGYFSRVGPERSFRFPNFKAIRNDKLPKECVWE